MNDFSRFNSRLKEPRLPRSSLVAWSLFALLVVFITGPACSSWMRSLRAVAR